MKKILTLAALAAVFTAGTAHADYVQSYDAQGHYLRLPAGYNQPDHQGQGSYTYQAPATMMPQTASLQSTTVQTQVAPSMLPAGTTATTTTTTTTLQPLDTAEVVQPVAPVALTVSDAASANSLMPAAGPLSLNDRSAVRVGAPCTTGVNHRASNKMMNTSTTVTNDCLD